MMIDLNLFAIMLLGLFYELLFYLFTLDLYVFFNDKDVTSNCVVDFFMVLMVIVYLVILTANDLRRQTILTTCKIESIV